MDRLPHRQTHDVLEREVAGELVVYELTRHRAHCLSPAAARVWTLAGAAAPRRVALAELAARVSGEPEAEALLERAISDLTEAGLLTPDPSPPSLDRRRFVLGAAAASLVTSILVPTAAMAQSGNLPNNAACISSSQCQSGCCRQGRCKPGGGDCS